jgi:alkylation response protein AidB-like acyl-CoA dehydrogenase
MTAVQPLAGLELTTAQRDLQERARRFVEEVLIPREEMAERAGGALPPAEIDVIRRAAMDARLHGGLHAVEHGGQGWSHVEWCLVEEQLGRSTNGLSWHIPNAYNVLAHGTPAQVDKYLRPGLRGESQDAYAVTEEHAGSDPSAIATTAVRTDGGFRIEGEKWFVTSGDVAAVYIVVANVLEDGAERPTLFLVDRDTPGIAIVDDPPFTHAYPHGHPTVRFTAVEVPEDAVLGAVGAGDDLQRAWFTEERLGIAARGLGAMWRLLEESVAWATTREQGGARIYDHQGVSFPLADSAADAAAGRALTLAVCALADDPAGDPKLVHGKASMAKLFVSERAWVCADRSVQTFGGRGYVRTNVAERFLRELRVDRIWEGTSEIQRLIVARSMERRGVERLLH